MNANRLRGYFIYITLCCVFFGGIGSTAAQDATRLRLPPSLERELQLKGANVARVVRFSDTLKADKLIAKSIHDTSGLELDSTMVHDSAIVVLDSAVSLSHKAWLDSMIAELPETRRTSDGLRFRYPDRMMVTTARRQVPFDSTIVMRMDPVSKEDMPLFEELRMPNALIASVPPKYQVRLGVGTPYAPSIAASARLVNGTNSLLDAEGSFINRISTSSPFSNEWSLGVHGLATFASDDRTFGEPTPTISGTLSLRSLTRDLLSDSGDLASTLLRSRFDGNVTFGTLSLLRATSDLWLHYLNDNVGSELSERSGGFNLNLEHQADDSSNRFAFGVVYDGVSGASNLLRDNSAIGVFQAVATVSSVPNSFIDWRLGVSLLSASDADANTLDAFPRLMVGKRLTNDLTVFMNLSQEARATSFDELSEINPFFAPLQLARDTSLRSLLLSDTRRATVTKYHVTFGINYFISEADYLHITMEFGSRHNEVAFFDGRDSGGMTKFYANVLNTHFFAATAEASLQLFRADRLTLSTHFGSTTDATNDKQLPYIPTMSADAEYSFGSIATRFIPSIGVELLARPDANFVFINAGATYQFSDNWSAELQLQNIFGNDGAYWAPYNEHLRRVGVIVTGRF